MLALATLHNVAPLLYDCLIHASRITHHVPPYQPSTPELSTSPIPWSVVSGPFHASRPPSAVVSTLRSIATEDGLRRTGITHHELPPYQPSTPTLSTTPVPSNVLQRLREIYLMTGARNTLLYQELGLVLQALQHDNIPVIVLKGAHLAALVYRHIALRPMSDIDLLVRRSDLERAAAKLHDLGFTGPPAGEVPMVSQEGHHLPMMHKAPETGIEVHWAPFWPPRLAGIANDGCWARSCPATIAGAATRVLSPEDLLLHVCLHDACHAPHGPFGSGLRPLCDIAEIIRHYRETIWWAEVQARAVEWHAERSVYLALWLARELLGVAVPPSVMEGLCPRDFDERWAAVAIKQVLEAPEGLSRGPGLQQAPLRVWAESCRSQWRRGNNEPLVRAVVRAVFPSRQHMARYMAMHHSVSLHGVRHYSCYLTRAWDWGRKVSDWAWQRAAHPRRMSASAQLAREHDRLWNWLSS